MNDADRNFKRINIHVLLALLFSCTLVIINILRIFNISITHDETGYSPNETYLQIIQSSYKSANNHILHSVFRKFFVETFANNVFFMRLDSLLAQITFLIFTYLLCAQLFKSKWWQLCSFVIINISSPLLFEFWGLSRGYALAITLMVMSIYYLLYYLETKKIKWLCICIVMAVLSVYTNFALINYFAAVTGTLGLQYFIFYRTYDKRQIFREISVILTATVILGLLIYRPIKNVYGYGELDFMGNNGFIADTVTSVVKWGFYIWDPHVGFPVKVILTVTAIEGFYWVVTYLKKLKAKEDWSMEYRTGITLFTLLIVPAISLKVQHKFFGINYLIDRTALFLLVLFVIQLIYWLYYLKARLPVVSWSMITGISLLVIYNFCSNVNVTEAKMWWYDRDDLNVLNRIISESTNHPKKIKIYADWIFVPSLRYYINQKYTDHIEPIEVSSNTNGKDTSYDYYYLSCSEVGNMAPAYSVDEHYVGGGYVLFRKNANLPAAK